MSAKELRAQVRAAFPAEARVLVVGAKGANLPGAHEISAPDAIVQGRWDGIAWFARDDLRANLARLRGALVPEGRLVLVVEPTGLSRQLWGALSGANSALPIAFEAACEALILAGLSTPRVLVAGKRGFALLAHAPERREALDAFFEQPLP